MHYSPRKVTGVATPDIPEPEGGVSTRQLPHMVKPNAGPASQQRQGLPCAFLASATCLRKPG